MLQNIKQKLEKKTNLTQEKMTEKIDVTRQIFILNDEYLEIKYVNYTNGELLIKTSNNYALNIDINFDITALKNDVRENISKKIYIDQNFITEKYSYVIDIGNDVYLTKKKIIIY